LQEVNVAHAIGVIEEDRTPIVPALHDMHRISRNEDSGSASHGPKVTPFAPQNNANNWCLTPLIEVTADPEGYWICFSWKNGNAYRVEIVDYH